MHTFNLRSVMRFAQPSRKQSCHGINLSQHHLWKHMHSEMCTRIHGDSFSDSSVPIDWSMEWNSAMRTGSLYINVRRGADARVTESTIRTLCCTTNQRGGVCGGMPRGVRRSPTRISLRTPNAVKLECCARASWFCSYVVHSDYV